jgi:two-component system, NtrC family, sensor kinase
MRYITLIFLFFSLPSYAQQTDIFRIDNLPIEGMLLNKGWKFHAGDNPDWAKVNFDDSAWEAIDPTKTIPELKPLNTDNPLWLRLKFSNTIHKSVAISIIQSGATEIFLNGKLIHRLGEMGNKNKKPVAYDPLNELYLLNLDTAENTLAIRYVFQKGIRYNAMFNDTYPLFAANLRTNSNSLSAADMYAWNGFNIGIPLILFLVHFIFFISYTPSKTNLWYSLSSLFGCIASFFIHKSNIEHNLELRNNLTDYAMYLGQLNTIFLFITMLLFLKQKNKLLLILFISVSIIQVVFQTNAYMVLNGVFNIIFASMYVGLMIYMGIKANKQGIQGGKYVALGALLYIIFWTLFTLSIMFQWGNIGVFVTHDILFHLATLTIPLIFSVLLGLEFKNTNLALIKNLEDINNLAAEKQQILSTQNETLEKQVRERTTELNNSLETLKATQNQLIQKEKLASLGELTAGIAHEIQNPLNFVNNFSELSVDLVKDLKDELKRPEKDEVYIDELFDDLSQNQAKINHHGKRASSIVKGMLEHSRASTGVRELTDINKLADEYLRLSYHGLRAKDKDFNADFSTQFDENLPKIEVIPQDMGRVLLNLINNAFYAVNQRAQLSKSSKLLESSVENYTPSVSVTTQQIDNQIIIKVKDNGTGMPESVRAKVFQPFFTTKPTGSGTGLGLSLAYDIVTKGHGGTLEVISIEGDGSEFIITLPTLS